MNKNVSPIKQTNRLIWIDAARGFAVFGIFIVNIGAFSAPYFLYGGAEQAWSSSMDLITQAIIDIFFQASFYTLFSLLFGFGFQIMKERLIAREADIYAFLIRRLFILIGFGMIHAFFIWYGDILLSYGLIGLLLLLFLQVKEKTLILWGVILLGGSAGLVTLMLYPFRDYLDIYDGVAIRQAFQHYQSSDLIMIWSQNYNDWVYSNGGISYLLLGTTLLPLFLFGMYVAKKRWLHKPMENEPLLIRLWIISFVLFAVIKAGPYIFGNPLWFSYIQDNIGGAASALFYIFSITLLAQKEIGKKLIQPFIWVGRMALTNYIMQSVISFILFYGIGAGLYGSIRPITGVVIAIIVFSIQVLFSKWWFSRYLFGPLEWIWRSLTYRKRQPFRQMEK
ncbi:hypothetical protein CIL03_14790 [Virgibacillus indicus]|uniref:DUF418 domain-containing protein n=1 Tax=Virgibacillus indicus TaxID=2024554 RepID=A0A265N9G6_9BACI|nr:DUF418 domain-containing protein [Virgibacillus indicus]OZU87966.1 hypothetical protein CIL03_14790 [Virgibacillus indicus]